MLSEYGLFFPPDPTAPERMANSKPGTAPRYGGRRARLLDCLYEAADQAGFLRPHRAIEWGRVRRLVMVCKGNICRSPYADARARLLGINALSCGLECGTGAPAHEAAIRNAWRREVELRPHRTLPFSAVRLHPGDLILPMEPAQARRIAPWARATGAQISLLGLWSGHPHVHDPYGLDDDAFQSCYARIDDSIAAIHALLSEVPLTEPPTLRPNR